jgi:predicted GNAT family acetyltransferase
MNDASDSPVLNNIAESRFEATVDGLLCVAEYLIKDDRMVFTHTFVPAELRGRGVAEKLVRTALAEARAKQLKVIPACSYVARFIDRHKEYGDLLAS